MQCLWIHSWSSQFWKFSPHWFHWSARKLGWVPCVFSNLVLVFYFCFAEQIIRNCWVIWQQKDLIKEKDSVSKMKRSKERHCGFQYKESMLGCFSMHAWMSAGNHSCDAFGYTCILRRSISFAHIPYTWNNLYIALQMRLGYVWMIRLRPKSANQVNIGVQCLIKNTCDW
jgi:hypothetical protein